VLKKKEETDSLAHTRWNCKYHIVFAPKYRRQVIYGQIKFDIGSIIRKLCEYKGVGIIEAEACPDHIHTLVSIPPKYSVSQFMGYLKGKSSLMIFDRHTNLKYKYGNRQFWCKGYYVDTVGRNMNILAREGRLLPEPGIFISCVLRCRQSDFLLSSNDERLFQRPQYRISLKLHESVDNHSICLLV